MISLQGFEQEISAAMVQKGKQYYAKGYVTELEEAGDNHWTAEVEGSEVYHVEVMLGNGDKLKKYSCDCLYDGSPCKHEVAVFFALRDELGKKKTKPANAPKKDVFKSILQSVSLKEYQDFITSYAAKNKLFKTEFELFFADKDTRVDVGEKYAGLVKKIISKHSNRGYIEYRSSSAFARDVDNLTDAGASYLSKRNFKDAFAVAKALIKPVMVAVTNADDSNGAIAGSIENIIELLEHIAEGDAAAIDLKEELLAYLQTELNDKTYFDYGDFGYHLLDVFQNLALQLNEIGVFIAYIDRKLAGAKTESYRRQNFVQRKLAVLAISGRNEEASELVQQHMDIPEVRRGEVEKAIVKKDFATAKKMVAEGIQLAQRLNHPGTVTGWQKQLLEIAVKEKDLTTIRFYTKQFAFDTWFSADYYKQWKITYTPEEWKAVIEKHIEGTIEKVTSHWKTRKLFRQPHPPLLEALAPIYIQEQYWDRLLLLVQQASGLNTTLEYHEYLVKQYPAQLLAIYLPALEEYGNNVSDRSGYADLVKKMRIIIKSLPEGKEKIQAIAQKLKTTYSVKPRRPAMIEELDKLLKG